MTISESQIRRIENRLGSLEETVEVLADKKLLQFMKKALDDIKHGRYSDYKDISELRAKLEPEK